MSGLFKLPRLQEIAHLPKPVHAAMVTDDDWRVAPHRFLTRFMDYNARCTGLHDMYRHTKRATERLNFGLAAPLARISNEAAIPRKAFGSHEAIIMRSCAVFACERG